MVSLLVRFDNYQTVFLLATVENYQTVSFRATFDSYQTISFLATFGKGRGYIQQLPNGIFVLATFDNEQAIFCRLHLARVKCTFDNDQTLSLLTTFDRCQGYI